MSKKRAIKAHQRQLDELNSIMNAMKNLAFLETRKLAQRMESLKEMLNEADSIARDFLQFYPQPVGQGANSASLWIVLGSERGFCGDFNEALKNELTAELSGSNARHTHAIVVGSRLHSLLDQQATNLLMLPGAAVSEEMPAVLTAVVDGLESLQVKRLDDSNVTINALYHNFYSQQIERLKLWPTVVEARTDDKSLHQPAVINLAPALLYAELTLHYFPIALQEIFTMSLMAENQRRIQHMEGATQHLERISHKLTRSYQKMRQEEITEEIELLIVGSF